MKSIMAVFLFVMKVLPSFCCIIACNKSHLSSAFVDVEGTPEQTSRDYVVEWLIPDEKVEATGTKFFIFCQKSLPKHIVYIWRTTHLEFEKPYNYILYEGENETEVYQKYKSEAIFNPALLFTWENRIVSFPAFNQHCLGVSAPSKESYSLRLKVCTVNYWLILQMVIGGILLLSAPSLSRNSFFHYTSGVSLGVIASVLIVVFILLRFIPKKSISFTVLAFGSSFVCYLWQQVYKGLPHVFENYTDIVLGYIFLSAFVSFIFCYRLGPVENVRTCYIIQWTVQGLSLILIFFSSEYREISTAIIIILLTARIILQAFIKKIKLIRYLPPKVKLFAESEYVEQGALKTKKALDELQGALQGYCSKCKAWSTVLKLKGPNRFVRFIEDESHLTKQEILLYNSESASEDGDILIVTDDDGEGMDIRTRKILIFRSL